MAYTRDKDAHTRGPGASASHDRSRVHRARRARMLAASDVRDSYLAGLTYGARGAMGAANIAGTVMGSGNVWRPVIGPPSETPPGKPVWGGNVVTVVDPPAPKIGVLPPFKVPLRTPVTAVQPATKLDRGPGFTPTTIIIDPMRETPTTIIVDPTSAPPKTPYTGPTQTTGGGSAGGAGKAGGGVTPGGGSQPPIDLPDAEDAQTSSSKPPWLMIAAIAGGLWLLLRDKDGDS